MLYLDSAASSLPETEAAAALERLSRELPANPSSLHEAGRKAAQTIEKARSILASGIKAKTEEIIFVASGTEANNTVLFGCRSKFKKKNTIIAFLSEHLSVMEPLKILKTRGINVKLLRPPGERGIIFDDLLPYLDESVYFVSVMQVNNESGIVTDVAALARELKKKYPDVMFHTDAVQGYMKIPFNLVPEIDFYTVSAHKIFAPSGAGFIAARKKFEPLLYGGGQEQGRRSGTENTAAIGAMACAAGMLEPEISGNFNKMLLLNKKFPEALTKAGINYHRLFPENAVSPYILSISLPEVKSEVIIRMLSDLGIYLSASSACSEAGNRERVLTAYNILPAMRSGALRISLYPGLPADAPDIFASALKNCLKTYR
ncbi:MAG: hypothetical protein A2096_16410 [Spirochaetes bacterium GWF1_41_5]|nr:MAG: hypothetical protein A2096_16410 [Spirochaetes bacterium GWF1_41_5]HBE01372.1 hypothetical protein [Spirochaetia bacterium]